jgi:iron complex outermembrane receptor protein
MKQSILFALVMITGMYSATAQDTIPPSINLQEIVISTKGGINNNLQPKPTASVEEFLQTSEKIGMIRRGSYAWEPGINNMTAERISVTIDGMKIFHACTDRMDPVTSYIETVNLNKVILSSGFEANPNASNNIGGSLDLQLNKGCCCCDGFCSHDFSVNLHSGFESNGNLWVNGADLSFANRSFYVNSGLFHRQSGNYRAGKSADFPNGKEIAFSQFTKNNFFTNLGYRVAQGKMLEGTLIFDHASDVGYPALTMDVKTAQGLITSIAYTVDNPFNYFSKWKTKVYYNNIIHSMDDTKRPNVALHMDMPGKSRTGGAYSSLNGQKGNHDYMFNWDAYYNQSYAEMTMYSGILNEKPMFMLTWPDVGTFNTGLFLMDEYRFDDWNSFRFSAKGSFQRDGVNNKEEGLSALQVYYPDMKQYRNRFVGNIAGRYQFAKEAWELSAITGYGSRAPSVSEAYGFYLYNSFDAYDYLGNPHLKQESAVETSVSLGWKKQQFNIKTETSYFYFTNYIIGKPDAGLSQMTLGASGVKVYRNLPHASILTISLSANYRFLPCFLFKGFIKYARGQDNGKNNLPLIAPLSYDASILFRKEKFSAEAGVTGAARQLHFSPEYGEDETKNYLIANLSAGYGFKLKKYTFNLKAGIENLFNLYYSTYSDWNHIPRKGRNIFMNLEIGFN